MSHKAYLEVTLLLWDLNSGESPRGGRNRPRSRPEDLCRPSLERNSGPEGRILCFVPVVPQLQAARTLLVPKARTGQVAADRGTLFSRQDHRPSFKGERTIKFYGRFGLCNFLLALMSKNWVWANRRAIGTRRVKSRAYENLTLKARFGLNFTEARQLPEKETRTPPKSARRHMCDV